MSGTNRDTFNFNDTLECESLNNEQVEIIVRRFNLDITDYQYKFSYLSIEEFIDENSNVEYDLTFEIADSKVLSEKLCIERSTDLVKIKNSFNELFETLNKAS